MGKPQSKKKDCGYTQNEESIMKRRIYVILAALLGLLLAVFSGCSGCDDPLPEDNTNISVTASCESISLSADEVEGYNFAVLFEIKADGNVLAVLASYIDSSAVKAEPGEYAVSCSYKGKTASVKVTVTATADIRITPLKDEITLETYEIENYDFTSLFEIKKDGAPVDVLKEYIDSSAVKAEEGRYTVKCGYGSKQASVSVKVVKNAYALSALESEVTVSKYIYPKFNFKNLFSATVNGVKAEITDDMVTSDVKAEPGEYTYTVRLGDKTASVKVVITDDHDVRIVKSYALKEIPVNELGSFDFTTLFTVYVDMQVVETAASMIDTSALENAEANNTYDVTLSYESDGASGTATASVKVVPEFQIAVSTKNVETYPNAGTLDLTTLFEIMRGGERIPVTYDMLSGTVDYSHEGTSVITLTYEGKTYTAQVKVVMGVVINYANGDTVTIKKGTNKSTYSFGSDFIVTINGIRYGDVERCVDASGVDFDRVGEYTATITVNYNTETPDFFDVNFTTVTKTITYSVVDVEYTLDLKEETVSLSSGTQSYDVFSNVMLVINGINQSLTLDKKQSELINACYAEVVSEPLDFTSAEKQTVELDLYVYGAEAEPVSVSYFVVIESDIVIVPASIALFGKTTVFTADLFEITENGVPVTVTQDMISGYVNTFKAGMYTVEAEYKGVRATACVTVYGSDIVGRYKTGLQTIDSLTPPEDEDDDYSDEYWGMESGGTEYSARVLDASRASLSSRISDLVIYEDGRITLHGKECTNIRSIDENTLSFYYYTNEYTMHYSDGTAVLIPDNSLNLGYNQYKRPMIYFNMNKWLVPDVVIINYSAAHVLTLSYPSYSIDVCELVSPDGKESMWYGLKIRLSEKNSTDTAYEVVWGEVTFADNFSRVEGVVSSLELDGETYEFTMTDSNVGKINISAAVNPYVGKRFTGTVNGKPAELRSLGSGYSYSVDGEVVFGAFGTNFEITNYMVGGGLDLATDILTLNSYVAHDSIGVVSYKFKLYPETNTFELLERDNLFGRYESGDIAYFLDGYGHGCVQFDKNSSVKTKISYTASAGELTVRYLDTGIRFEYGKESKFYIGTLLNTLTVKEFTGLDIVGTSFENTVITDGAIVHIKSFTIGAGTEVQGKARLFEAFEIIDKNGVWSDADKSDSAKFDTSKVAFGTPGFYRLILSIPVGGTTVESYYSIQVLEKTANESPVISIGGAGVIYSSASLLMDSYGRAFVTYAGSNFTGSVTVNEDNSFVIKAFGALGEYLYGVGSFVSDGLISVRFGGAMQFSDYFKSGTTRAVGGKGLVLREFTCGGISTYIVSSTASSLGEKATVELVEGTSITASGALLKITSESGVVSHVRISAWGNIVDGLSVISAGV